MKATRHTSPLVVAASATLLLASACGASTSPADPEPDGTQTAEAGTTVESPDESEPAVQPAAPTETAVVASTPTDEATAEDDDLPVVTGVPNRPSREELAERVSTQLTCPDGRVEIDKIGFVTEITEDCAEVVVLDGPTTVLAQDVGNLVVEGTGPTVYAKQLDSVTLAKDATASLVVWESGSPVVDDASVGSTVVSVDQLP